MTMQSRRKEIISKIIQTMKEIRSERKEIVPEKFIANISFQYGCSLRTAREYYQIAENNL